MLQKTDGKIMNNFGRLGCLKPFTVRGLSNPFVGRIYGIASPPDLYRTKRKQPSTVINHKRLS